MARKPDPLKELSRQLSFLLDQLGKADLTPHKRRSVDAQLAELMSEIDKTRRGMDPIEHPSAVFDASDPNLIGRFVALALVAQDRQPLSNVPSFYGSGVYAIYYEGAFGEYQPISRTETPIYVGKATPASAHAANPYEQGNVLSKRVTEHSRNVAKVPNLDISDFSCRMLVVQTGYEAPAEKYLIKLFQPVWNKETKIVYGIGKHGDSASTRSNKRSPWDTLHPSRKWAGDGALEDAKSIPEIQALLKDHFANQTVFNDVEQVVEAFMDGLRQTTP